MSLAGHEQPATTARCLRLQLEAAAEVLVAAHVAAVGAAGGSGARPPHPAHRRADLSPFGGEVPDGDLWGISDLFPFRRYGCSRIAVSSLQLAGRVEISQLCFHTPTRQHRRHVESDLLIVRAHVRTRLCQRVAVLPDGDGHDVERGRAARLFEDHVATKTRERRDEILVAAHLRFELGPSGVGHEEAVDTKAEVRVVHEIAFAPSGELAASVRGFE